MSFTVQCKCMCHSVVTRSCWTGVQSCGSLLGVGWPYLGVTRRTWARPGLGPKLIPGETLPLCLPWSRLGHGQVCSSGSGLAIPCCWVISLGVQSLPSLLILQSSLHGPCCHVLSLRPMSHCSLCPREFSLLSAISLCCLVVWVLGLRTGLVGCSAVGVGGCCLPLLWYSSAMHWHGFSLCHTGHWILAFSIFSPFDVVGQGSHSVKKACWVLSYFLLATRPLTMHAKQFWMVYGSSLSPWTVDSGIRASIGASCLLLRGVGGGLSGAARQLPLLQWWGCRH